MNLQHELDSLIRDFQLHPGDVHFLELVPLIEMMWADGRNQDSELKILYQFTIEHLAAQDRANACRVLSSRNANEFLNRFAHRRPSQELLDRLHQLVLQRHACLGDSESRDRRRDNLLDYCLEIATACASAKSEGEPERVMAEEKAFLKRLIGELSSPSTFS